MSDRFDIVIAGAGMIGLTIASLLARSQQRQRLRLTVLDAAKPPVFERSNDVGLRVSAISLGSANVLREAGVWQSIARARISPYQSMRVWDSLAAAESSETLRFDAADFAIPELGYIVENALIRQALLDAAAYGDVDVRFQTAIEQLAPTEDHRGYRVILSNGRTLTPDLVIAADGAASRVRQAAGIAVRAWQYPQSAFVTHVQPEFDHQRTAWQRFLRKGPIALLPLADGRASVVWSTTPEQAAEAQSVDDETLGDWLSDASDRVLGRLSVAGPRGAFPLRAQHASHYVESGLALVGDAAHSVHPLAGQGANLGFADAAALAGAISDALGRGEYPGDLPTLRRYERARVAENATMLRFIDAINRLFLANSPGLRGLRRRGMRLFNRSGPVRRRAVQVALGINV